MRNVPLQTGFLLLPVAFMLVVVALAAFMLNRQSALNVDTLAGETQTAAAQFAAEAGLNHAIWQTNQASCDNYQNVPSTAFGYERYQADVTPTSGSPITIAATGTSANGTTRTLSRSPIQVFENTVNVVNLQLGTDGGKDAKLDSFYPRNYGGSDVLQVGYDLSTWDERPVIQFDLPALPTSSRILSAKLELKITSVQTAGPASVHRLTRDWVEGTKIGTGTSDGADWSTYDGTNPWASPGGDFVAEPAAEKLITSAYVGGWVAFEIEPLVTEWVSGKAPNHGLLLRSDGVLRQAEFWSKEATDPLDAPRLTITYSCECGVGGGSFTDVDRPSNGGQDTYIDDANPSVNFSTDTQIRLSNKTNSKKRGLIKFKLANVPPDANVTSATLQMNLEGIGSGGVASVDVHRVTKGWSGSGATWNNAAGGSLWITPGGDWDATVEATAVIDDAVPGPTTWDVTSLVRNWLDGTYPDEGFMLIGSADVNHADFTTSEDSNPSVRPQLTVNYTCPCGGCADVGPPPKVVLFVVADPAALTAAEAVTKALIESWAYVVDLIDDDDTPGNFNSAVNDADVAFITSDVSAATLDTKLTDATIGVVIEEHQSWGDLELCSDRTGSGSMDVDITDNTHYITSPFPTGPLTILSVVADMMHCTGTPGAGVVPLIIDTGDPGLLTLDTGALRMDGQPSTGRRATTAWGGNWDPTKLNDEGQQLLQRSLEWASGEGGGGSPQTVLLVSGNAGAPSNKDLDMEDLMVGWGFAVDWIDDGDTPQNFIDKMAAADVVYVSGTSSGPALLDKVTDVNKGVVNEINGKIDNFGFSSSTSSTASSDRFTTTDALHYITESFGGNFATVFTATATMPIPGGTLAPDLQNAGEVSGAPALVTLDAGATGWDGNPVPARRAHLPFTNVEPSQLTADGELIMQRTILWAAGAGGGSGGGGGTTGVVFEEFTERKYGSTTFVDNVKPPGTTEGDLLIATIATDGSTAGSMSPPAGWTAVDLADQSGAVTYGVWWKLAGASEPANYTFSWSGSEHAYGTVMRFTGHDPADPIDITAVAGGSSSAPSSPAVTTTVTDTMILRLGGFDDDDITTDAPGLSGHTAITMDDSGNGPSTTSAGAGYVMQPAVGDSGTSTFALTGTEEYRTVTLAIAPAP